MGELLKGVQMRVLFILMLLMAIIALGSYASLNFEKIAFLNPMPATIMVIGEGEVLAVPDIRTFSFSVVADGADAAQAQEASGTKINEILAYLSEQQIAETDIRTVNYSLNPKYKYEQGICVGEGFCPTNQVADGFEVSHSITVKVRDAQTAGAIVAGVGERGATNISNLIFTVDDTNVLRAEARTAALTDAKAQAVVLAEQLGVRIVRLSSYYENDNGYNEPYYDMRMMGMAADAESSFGGAELPAGEIMTKVQVNVVYVVE